MSRKLRTLSKDPDATLDYAIDWGAEAPGPWLGSGETIEDSSWIVDAGLTKVSESFDDSRAVVWLSGGTAGSKYTVTNRITTSDGRTDDRSLEILVVER